MISCYCFSPSLQPCQPWPWDMERVLKLLYIAHCDNIGTIIIGFRGKGGGNNIYFLFFELLFQAALTACDLGTIVRIPKGVTYFFIFFKLWCLYSEFLLLGFPFNCFIVNQVLYCRRKEKRFKVVFTPKRSLFQNAKNVKGRNWW